MCASVHSVSVQVVCRWVEELRDKLRRFCSESLPLFFLIMWVVVVGVVGSAVIIKILDLLFPTCEHKYVFVPQAGVIYFVASSYSTL